MKRAFDANVSKARPRTRTATVEREERAPLSRDLATALVGRRSQAAPARKQEASRKKDAPKPAANLAVQEQRIADRAAEVAHQAARETEAGGDRKKILARAMHQAAARAAEAAAQSQAARTPAWVVRAAVPVEDDDIVDSSEVAEAAPAAAKVAARASGETSEPAAARASARAAAETSEPAPARASARASAETEAAAKPVQAELEIPAERPAVEKPVATERPAAARVTTVARQDATAASAPQAAPTRVRERLVAPGEDTLVAGRARIAELRGRLASTQRPAPAQQMAPRDAAASVRTAVEALRQRLAEAQAERDDLAATLESTRDELSAAHRLLEERDASLAEARAVAQERATVAEELAAEADALAEERDRAVARILDLKRLDEEQTRLLEDAEAALAVREAELAEARTTAEELASLLDARAAEIEELAALAEERARERDRLARRVEELEAEVERLGNAGEALAEIQRLVAGDRGR